MPLPMWRFQWMDVTITFGTMEMTGALEGAGAEQYSAREMVRHRATVQNSIPTTHTHLLVLFY